MGIINRVNRSNVREVGPSGKGFCHAVEVYVHLDGSVTPSSIILGNKGDKDITNITFHLEELAAADFCGAGLDAYMHRLVLSNGDELDVFYTPQERTSDVSLPASICSESGTLSLVYELIESNPPLGNIEKREIFISNVFHGVVNETEWNNNLIPLIDEAEEETDLYQCLTKNNIEIGLDSLHYKIHTSTTNLGNKFDNYITRITFIHEDDLDEGLSERFALFKANNITYITKFQTLDDSTTSATCWIPPAVLQTAGNVTFFIVARTSDKTKRWVSNSLIMRVEDNFLTAPIHILEIYGPNQAMEGASFTLEAQCETSSHNYTWTASGINLTPDGNMCYCVGNNTGEYTIYCQCDGAQASHDVTITSLDLRTETYTFSDHYSSNTSLDNVEISINYYLSMNFSQYTGGTAPQYYSNGSTARLYTGNKMSIHCLRGKIRRVVFTFSPDGTKNRDFNIDVGTYNNPTWIGDNNHLNCVVYDSSGGGATSGHLRLRSLEITYYVN